MLRDKKSAALPSSPLRQKKRSPATQTLRDKTRRPFGLAFRRFRDASMRVAPMDARHCVAPITDFRWPGKKNCSVNFRPFSAYKERSEFETVPCPKKSLYSFYVQPCRTEPPRQGCRPSGLAFRRFRDASMRAALMDARPCAAPITDMRWPGKKSVP